MVPETMKAVVVRKLGDASVLSVEDNFPTPSLQQNHVLVKNELIGLNFIDTYYRSGLYKKDLPFVSGQEGGGKVVAISPDAQKSGIVVGDTVVYMSFGSYAEFCLVPVDKMVKVPDGVDMGTAVACMTQGLTAHYLVTDAHAGLLGEGEWCLIYSVGSGTCQWAAQMAKIRGYRVIGTTSEGKKDVAKEAGCDELIVLDEAHDGSYADYASVDILAKVMEITGGQGVKAIIDGVGMSTTEISLSCLARRGIFISFGNASGAVPSFPVLRLTPKSAFVTRPKLGDYIATREELDGRCRDVFNWLKDGKLRLGIDTVFQLDKAAEGHEYLESGKSRGKVLLKI
uniref:Enoyl reductase (ER) domain-containing protein n=2 Tax=Odontella aurita TaxID=265563 RepID=A0A7S4MAY6_9STRA|mmetsp:Transcript_16281/g.46908  ORF Transcript_16281/g.46908 Transcript_16281/m.46908 type:complete len:341 (+) Transcript_16281:184-1206(+)